MKENIFAQSAACFKVHRQHYANSEVESKRHFFICCIWLMTTTRWPLCQNDVRLGRHVFGGFFCFLTEVCKRESPEHSCSLIFTNGFEWQTFFTADVFDLLKHEKTGVELITGMIRPFQWLLQCSAPINNVIRYTCWSHCMLWKRSLQQSAHLPGQGRALTFKKHPVLLWLGNTFLTTAFFFCLVNNDHH